MSNFRDAIQQVQAAAAQGDLTALETVLHDPNAERAARLVAANLLAQAGEEGAQTLLAAVLMGDSRARAAALRAYLRVQDYLDETLILEATHSKDRHVRRGVRRLLGRLPYPVSDEFRLRCRLPRPYCNVLRVEENLAEWLRTCRGNDLIAIMNAVSTMRYPPALPLLIEAMGDRSIHYYLATPVARFGAAAVPLLLEALPDSKVPQRNGLLQALQLIGGPEAEAAVKTYTTQPVDLTESDAARAQREALAAASRVPGASDVALGGWRGAVTELWKRLRGK